jgi:hypothetical protein
MDVLTCRFCQYEGDESEFCDNYDGDMCHLCAGTTKKYEETLSVVEMKSAEEINDELDKLDDKD